MSTISQKNVENPQHILLETTAMDMIRKEGRVTNGRGPDGDLTQFYEKVSLASFVWEETF